MTELLVEMGWGGLVQEPDTITWSDITDYVDVVQGVSITRGASDELAETQPGTATLILDNLDGRFTPGNPASPYWPHVRRNAPIRISVVTGAVTYPRFYGLVNEFPAAWSGLMSTVSISCTDLFKRLNRLPALRSVLAEEILIQAAEADSATVKLAAYYPLGEESGATSAGDLSGIGGGPLVMTQALSGGSADFGGEGPPALGAGAVSFEPETDREGKYLLGDLGAQFELDDVSSWQTIEGWFKTATPERAILGLHSANLDHQLVFAIDADGALCIEHTDIGGTRTVTVSISARVDDDAWHHFLFDAEAGGLWLDGVALFVNPTLITLMSALRILHVGAFRGIRLFSGQIAHVCLWHSLLGTPSTLAAAHWEAGTTAFAGEPADERIVRLARYVGLHQVDIVGDVHDSIAGQGAAGTTVTARMREVETTEAAKLFAERDSYGIAYHSRDVRYNPDPADDAFTIEYADLETPDFLLADDDQKLVNTVTASRPGGATQRVTDPVSVERDGPYEQQLDVLKMDDAGALAAAQWMVSRYADPAPELREVPVEAYTLPIYADVLGADIGSVLTVTDLPAQAPEPSMRVIVEGYSEVIKQGSHQVRFLTSAAITDSVWILDDPTYSVLDVSTRLAY
ncbi:LamG domain-containing protein [Streptomyces sp. NBC_01775]|uniref:hypothetical protein n=1 Tax=Streptomyces sp. NBC_01775 TaxID=2975939 RepID=UPI002DDB4190|nr:hypothetical protein [Streptomyces sp. NBC_01775]WSB78336.1 LamG domain-containing protein [Streptomyces sp. NBC_01775]